MKKSIGVLATSLAIMSVAFFALFNVMPAFAASNTPNYQNNGYQNNQDNQQNDQGGPGRGRGMGQRGQGMMRPGVIGLVTEINGSILSVASRGFPPGTATTTYSVNAASATIVKNNATTTLSSITVGDMVFVQGTVSTTTKTVTATMIRDGMLGMMRGRGQGTSTNPWNSDGKPGNGPKNHPGFFGSIGQFFKNMFHF